MKDPRIGILTSIDWNSNYWAGTPSTADLENSKFGYVQENGLTHTYLNFVYENLAPESEGYVYALLPQLWSKTPQSENVQIVIVRSQNWQDGKTYIVGLYLFPIFKGQSKASEFPEQGGRVVNIKTLAVNVVLLDRHIQLTQTSQKGFLPEGKDLGTQGFNYLKKENVMKILDEMTKLNPENKRLSSIKFKFLKNNN